MIREVVHKNTGGLPAPATSSDFRDVITMLKIWDIPFDILRLDQKNLRIIHFLNGIAEPNSSCLIWMTDPDKLKGSRANYETLRRAIEGTR